MALSMFDKAVQGLQKQFGEDVFETGKSETSYDRIPFSSPRLNYMTFGGIPTGIIVEFSGPEGSGKTTTAIDIMKNAQRKFEKEAKETKTEPKRVVVMDVEGTFDYNWSNKFGLDTTKISRFNMAGVSAQDILNSILTLLDTGEVGLLVLDSIASMVPEQLESKGVGEKIYGGLAQSLQNFCLKANKYLKQYKSTIICINQVRDNLNSMFGGTITPGGRGFKHMCSLRMEFRKGKFIDENNKELTNNAENPAGNLINVVVLKSKVFPSTRRVGYYTIKYISGPDLMSDYIEVGLQVGVINQRGAFYDIIDPSTGEILNESKLQGKVALKEALSKHQDWLDIIDATVDGKDIVEITDEETLAQANETVAKNKE